jgi:hypothetical protein
MTLKLDRILSWVESKKEKPSFSYEGNSVMEEFVINV